MHVVLDTNVILDVVFEREPFAQDAEALLLWHDAGDIRVSLVATTLTTIDYLVRKARGADEARRVVDVLLATFGVCPVDQAILRAAAASPFRDFEDAVQDAAAEAAGIAIIVTRDPRSFIGSTRRILDAGALLRELRGGVD